MTDKKIFVHTRISDDNKAELVITKDGVTMTFNYEEMLKIWDQIDMVKYFNGELPF